MRNVQTISVCYNTRTRGSDELRIEPISTRLEAVITTFIAGTFVVTRALRLGAAMVPFGLFAFLTTIWNLGVLTT